jgi:uncharacterized phage protein gp47/JayE
MYTPRSTEEITRDLVARMVARTELTDISEGSVLLALMRTFAEQIADADVRLNQIRRQFTLEGAQGADLDERVDELGLSRLSATRASGSVTVTRGTTTSELTLPAGSAFGRTDSEVTYITNQVATFAIGVAFVDVSVIASVVGASGDAPPRSINKLVDVPDDIVSVLQGSAISNGRDEEVDENLRARAQRHIASLSRCHPNALEYLALSFSATDGTRATTATLRELPDVRGECELLIDDGSGLGDQNLTRSGREVTVDLNSVLGQVIGIESPLADYPTVLNGSTPLIRDTHYTVSRERGLISLLSGAPVSVGDTLTINNYTVYIGLISELQNAIEGTAGDVSSGYRSAGVSVRVLPAPVQRIDLNALISIVTGANLQTVESAVEAVLADYLSTLDAGAPALVSSMISRVMGVDNVYNVTLLKSGSSDNLDDIYPATPRTILRAGEINAVTSITGS